MRYAAKVDLSQSAIVDALRYAGVEVFCLQRPCDLLCRFRDKLFLLDCEGASKYRKRDAKQLEHFHRFGVKLVRTPEEALHAVGVIA